MDRFAAPDGPAIADVARSAQRRVRLEDVRWADIVFAMEDAHVSRLRAAFGQALAPDRRFGRPGARRDDPPRFELRNLINQRRCTNGAKI